MAVSIPSSSTLLLVFLFSFLVSLASACDRCVRTSRAAYYTSSLTLAGKCTPGRRPSIDWYNCACSVPICM